MADFAMVCRDFINALRTKIYAPIPHPFPTKHSETKISPGQNPRTKSPGQTHQAIPSEKT